MRLPIKNMKLHASADDDISLLIDEKKNWKTVEKPATEIYYKETTTLNIHII